LEDLNKLKQVNYKISKNWKYTSKLW
jgi:hypothetical protein